MSDRSSEPSPPLHSNTDAGRCEMVGTESQRQWASQIRRRVAQEFERVRRALESAAARQSVEDRIDTYAMIAILDRKCIEVMANSRAGYFIRDWQELHGRVRETITQDPVFIAIRSKREVRRRSGENSDAAATVGKH